MLTAGKKDKEDFKYYRLFPESGKLSQDDYEERLIKAVNSLVEAALKFENNVLAKCSATNECVLSKTKRM